MKRKYTDDDRARVYVALTVHQGNIKRTARETNVPVSTVRLWKVDWEKNPPSEELMEKAEQQAEEFVGNATRARDLALAEWESKVRGGEVGAKDLMVGVGVLTDKINLAKGLATSRTESTRRELDAVEIREIAKGLVQGALQAAKEREEIIEDAEWSEQSQGELSAVSKEA